MIISLCLAQVFECSKFKNVIHSRREMRGSNISGDNLLHCSNVLNCQTKSIISLCPAQVFECSKFKNI